MCGGLMAQLPLPFLQQVPEALVYDTSLDYGDWHLSGMMAVKYTEPGYHVVLTSKVGFTLMEMIIHPDSLEWIKHLPGKPRKTVLKALEKDFRLQLLTPLYKPERIKQKRDGYFVLKKNGCVGVQLGNEFKRVILAKSKGFLNFFKSTANFEYVGDGSIPERISLSRRFLQFEIEMIKFEI